MCFVGVFFCICCVDFDYDVDCVSFVLVVVYVGCFGSVCFGVVVVCLCCGEYGDVYFMGECV